MTSREQQIKENHGVKRGDKIFPHLENIYRHQKVECPQPSVPDIEIEMVIRVKGDVFSIYTHQIPEPVVTALYQNHRDALKELKKLNNQAKRSNN